MILSLLAVEQYGWWHMTDKESMAMALEALKTLMIERGSVYEKAIAALKSRLAQPEPIQSLQCFHCQVTIETLNDKVMHLLAQRTWVDISDEDIEECFTITPDLYLKRHIAQRISDKLKEKNKHD